MFGIVRSCATTAPPKGQNGLLFEPYNIYDVRQRFSSRKILRIEEKFRFVRWVLNAQGGFTAENAEKSTEKTPDKDMNEFKKESSAQRGQLWTLALRRIRLPGSISSLRIIALLCFPLRFSAPSAVF
jgi:hypothetical protein